MAKKVIVRNGVFSIVKAKRAVKSAFACLRDRGEITLIVEQGKVSKSNIIEIEKDYNLLTFDMKLAFDLVGFIAKISKAFAEEKVPIFLVSSYSTDHMLVKKKYLPRIEKKLKAMGFDIKK
jgi:hypothetical protein